MATLLKTPINALPGNRSSAVSAHMATRSRHAREAQSGWSQCGVHVRLRVVRRARICIAEQSLRLAESVHGEGFPFTRNLADALSAEVLPLIEACRFLERNASKILATNKLGRKGRPFWLGGLQSEVQRVPFGLVLILAPANYPLFLPGVQCLQALVAGNAVLWKPAAGTEGAAQMLAKIFNEAGLPPGLLQILDSSVSAGVDALCAGIDKVVLTGHAETGRAVLRELADSLTPSVMELSGCDAVFVLPGTDIERVVEALAFGMRLNGSATCMAPRRVFVTASDSERLLPRLVERLKDMDVVSLQPNNAKLLHAVLMDAVARGARLVLDGRSGIHRTDKVGPTLVAGVPPEAEILHTDVFAPVMSLCEVRSMEEAFEWNRRSPYALTAAIFGPDAEARELAMRLDVGVVSINDVIISTADPRVPFGGRRESGFGVTRGREGLLEMTTSKTVLHQKSKARRQYAPTTAMHEQLFAGYIEAVHGGNWTQRYAGARKLIVAAQAVAKQVKR